MPGHSIITSEQLEEFDRRGVLRFTELFSVDRVRSLREYVQSRLARLGLWKDGAWHLDPAARPRWPATGLKTSEAIGNKHPAVEALLEEPALRAVVEALLDGCAVDRKMSGRPQVLFTLPNSDTWTVPTDWHMDSPRLASGKQPGVQLFAFVDTVEPRGGGTLVLAGSHRLLNEGRFIRSREVKRLLCREPFFRELYSEVPPNVGERARLLGHVGTVGSVELEVMELTGLAGDAYLTDLRVLHSGAPNTADRPRIMATHRFVRADVVQELSKGYGWT